MLIESYLRYFSELCEGTRQAPAGITLTAQDANARAAELLAQIEKTGVPAFVHMCAEAEGTQIPQEEYDSFDPGQLAALLAQPETEPEPEAESPAAPVKSEIRDIYEVFLDSVCLDDALVQYLIDIVKRGARDEFETLSHAAARTILDMDDFLAWLGNKELLAGEDERACACIMDGCFERLTACPKWSQGGWLLEKEKSGLLPFDLHIHDLDVIVSLFGKPDSVTFTECAGRGKAYAEQYRFLYGYKNGLNVCAEAAWFNAARQWA